MSLNERNGGIVKLFEKDADVQIVDHKRKNLPANVYSYQFIEKSVQKGRLENLEAYKAGPSAARPVGATNIPAKGQRVPFTTQEDQLIYDYMQPHEKNPLSSVMGNKIYQVFAENHPGHTWQSWRDRYLKRLRDRPRPGEKLESNATTVREEDRRSHPSRASTSTSRAAAPATRRDEPPLQQQERKRKRSPKYTMSDDGTSDSTSSTQQGSTNWHPASSTPEVVIVSSASRREMSPQHEAHPKPKRARTTLNGLLERTIPQEKGPTEEPVNGKPSDEASTSIDSVFLELPFLPSSPVAEEAPEQDIDSWIDSRVRTGKGSEAQVIEALQCTSMDPELADRVLESLTAGKGIPTDMRGVWTAEDDRDLEAQDTRDIQRVIEKHGDLLNYRWDYLNMTRATPT
ncbi:Rap1 Myb domain-containing protein [Aspergillus desertorum]